MILTLKEINCQFISKDMNKAIKKLLCGIIIDRGLLRNKHKLYYNDDETYEDDGYRVLDERLFKSIKYSKMEVIDFYFEGGLIAEFFGTKEFKLNLPVNDDGKDITETVLTHYIGPLTKSKAIDDLLFNVLSTIIKGLGIYYTTETGEIGFGIKQRTKYKLEILPGGKRRKVNFSAGKITLESVLEAEINQGFINEKIGDPHRMYGYTHLLREHAKFRLTEWGKKVLIKWKKYNVVAATRGQGKTYKAALIAARGLLDSRPGFGGRAYKEIKYFVPNKEDVGTQVMEYIKSFIGDLAGFKLENGKKAFEFGKGYSIKCNITGNVFKIISLYNFGKGGELGSASGEGLACDLAIIDEAARIPDEFWFSFHQRAAFETSEFYISSTINEETPADHWFYRLLVDGEAGNENVSSHRITIDENEIMRYGKTDDEWIAQVEMIKSELRRKGEKEFFCRMYCIILEESNVFNLTGTIVPHNTNKYSDDDVRILGFDLGKLDDTAGLTLINLTHLEIEESVKVSNLTYGMQLLYAKDYKKKYNNLYVIGDRSGVGEAVSEQDTEGIVDVWIKSTGTGELKYNKQLNYYTANKGLIINTFATVLNKGIIKIPNNLTDLIFQLNNFIKMKSGRGEIVLYKGKGKNKDDLVLSGAYGIFYMYAILKLKTIEEISDYVKLTGNNSTYSYNDITNNNSGYSGDYYRNYY